MRTTPGPVTITYKTGTSGSEAIDCELLVIACDPRPLFGMAQGGARVLMPTPTEKAVFAPLTDYIFQTTLVSVDVPTDTAKRPKYGAILDPATARQMRGDIGAFRNESAKQYGLDVANTLRQNHLVVYQLWGPESEKDPKTAKPPTSAQLLQRLKDQLDDRTKVPWWPYESYTIDPAQPPLHTRYLHHYASEQLEQGLPWKLLEMQGDNRTLYTWAGTCFESVLQCWQYQDLLLSPDRKNPVQLPAALGAPIVIVGAGVSGLLMADRLRRLYGYTNVTLLEREAVYGGKTHSVVRSTSRPGPNSEPTICELGTCYLQPGYDELVSYLWPFVWRDGNNQPNERRGFVAYRDQPDKEFRGMVTTEIIDPRGKFTPPLVVGYDEYIALRYQQKTGEEVTDDHDMKEIALGELVLLLVEYAKAARGSIGSSLPMPLEPPPPDQMSTLTGTFQDWLDNGGTMPLNLAGLTGVLEYAYSNQGYGPLTSIPLYYGMVWISAVVAERLAMRSAEGQPNITFWSKGWGDVWRRMADSFPKGSIVTDATITSIQRPVPSGS